MKFPALRVDTSTSSAPAAAVPASDACPASAADALPAPTSSDCSVGGGGGGGGGFPQRIGGYERSPDLEMWIIAAPVW